MIYSFIVLHMKDKKAYFSKISEIFQGSCEVKVRPDHALVPRLVKGTLEDRNIPTKDTKGN